MFSTQYASNSSGTVMKHLTYFLSVPSIVKFTCRKITVSNLKKTPFKMVFLQNSSVYNNKEIGVLIKMSSILISLSVYNYSAYI